MLCLRIISTIQIDSVEIVSLFYLFCFSCILRTILRDFHLVVLLYLYRRAESERPVLLYSLSVARHRYFVLRHNIVFYFSTKDESIEGKEPIGAIDLFHAKASVIPDSQSEKAYSFQVSFISFFLFPIFLCWYVDSRE